MESHCGRARRIVSLRQMRILQPLGLDCVKFGECLLEQPPTKQAVTIHVTGGVRGPIVESDGSVEVRRRDCEQRGRVTNAMNAAHLYATLFRNGLMYGPAYQTVERVWRASSGETVGAVGAGRGGCAGYCVAPNAMDGMLQTSAIRHVELIRRHSGTMQVYVPESIRRVTLSPSQEPPLRPRLLQLFYRLVIASCCALL